MSNQESLEEKEDQDKSKKEEKKQQKEKSPPPTIVAWGIRGISLLLVGGILGFFIYNGLQKQQKPTISFDLISKEVEQRGEFWAVPVTVTNEGDLSVHYITVKSVLPSGDKPIEQQITIPIMGARQAVDTEFWFKDKPDLSKLEFNVVSFTTP